MLRRVVFEDAFLGANLEGYAEYRTARAATGWCRASGKEPRTGGPHRPAAVEDQLNGGGIETMLLDQDPRGQRLGRVVGCGPAPTA